MRNPTLAEQQAKCLEAIEVATEAREWLDSMRRNLVDAMLEVEIEIDRIKEASADAARAGVRVRRSDLLDETLSRVCGEMVDFGRDQDEWTA